MKYKILRIDTITENEKETNQYRFVSQEELEQVGLKTDEFKKNIYAKSAISSLLFEIKEIANNNMLEWEVNNEQQRVVFSKNHYCSFVVYASDSKVYQIN